MQKTELRRKASKYSVEGGALYYNKGEEIRAKVVCGAEEANAIFVDFHASATGAHTGQKKSRDAISKRFYWPGMSRDIDRWVAECAVCQSAQRVITEEVQYTPIKVTQPFELVGMELIGKLATTSNGNQYICVIIDYYTKWPQAYPLKTKTAEEVTEKLLKFIYQFEAPKRILTDQGTEFVNAINKNLCAKLGIRTSLCAPYHPQTNGLVERMNATIQNALYKLVGTKRQLWDEYLDAVMFGLRTKKQITTQYSPYYLMFGREARYPSEIPEDYKVDSSVEETLLEETVSKGIEQLEANISVSTSTAPTLAAPTPAPAASPASAPIPAEALTTAAAPAAPGAAAETAAATAPAAAAAVYSGTLSPTEVQKYVNEVWTGTHAEKHVILAKVANYKLFCWDIARIAPNQELESEVINAYLTVLVRQYNKNNVAQAAVIDSYEMTNICTGKNSKLKMDPLDYKMLLGVFNEHHHWMLTVIHPHEQRTTFLDPMGETQKKIQRCLQTTRAFMRKKGCKVSRWVCDSLPHGLQRDGTSCGVFALKFAECILEGKPLTFKTTTSAVNGMRHNIATTLLQESDTLKDLCHYCGSRDNDDPQWIACDNCGRWYHHTCVCNPPVNKEYLCPLCSSKMALCLI